jgi:uncharacterized membrane protein YtjA (UPF0391 family)
MKKLNLGQRQSPYSTKKSCSILNGVNEIYIYRGIEEQPQAGYPIKHWEGAIMSGWTLAFLIIALLAALLSFTGTAGTVTVIAKALFLIFLALFLASLIFGHKHV